MAVLFLLAATAYAVFQVPYVTMPAEMTEDPAERGRVLGWRVGFLGAAILLSGALAPAIAHAGGDTPASYRLMGARRGGAAGRRDVRRVVRPRGGLPRWRTRRPNRPSGRSSPPPGATRPFLYLAGMWTAQALAIGVMLAGVQYFATYTLGSASAVTPLFACMIGPLALVMPLWNRLARQRGVK